MTSVKFIITALAATIMFSMSVLGNPVLAATTVVTVPGFTLPFATLPPLTLTVSAPVQPAQTSITVTHLEKRVCNQYGCGMKCKGTANSICNQKLKSPSDCDICSYFFYNADGSAERRWDLQCLYIQWGYMAPLAKC